MIVQPEADEQIVTIRINEVGSDNNTLEKYGLAVSASAERCVTDFNYAFAAGKAYNFMVILESPEKKKRGVQPSARVYGASFSLWRLNGKLQTTPLY
nr:putative T6SS immunity periplasmic lipoprotein [Serratia sp. JUb9]